VSGSEETKRLDTVVRTLAVASKSLRLYPAASPLRTQAATAVTNALEEYFRDGASVLSLSVAREGLTWCGHAVCANTMGVDELVGDLRAHGVAEIDVTPGCSADELLAFIAILSRDASEVLAEGGIAALTAAAGVECIRVTDVHLTVVEQIGPAPDEDIEEFLRQLASDPEKLAAWLAVAAKGDPHAFEEGLLELVRVSGVAGFDTLLESLSGAFMAQNSEGRDALLGLSLEPGPTRDLTGGMFSFLSSNDIAGSILGGSFGRNMLSLSNALTKLPLEQVTAQVRADVQAMLPGAGHSSREADFLGHMIEVREKDAPEPALVDQDRTYRAVMDAAALTEEAIAAARTSVAGSSGEVSAAGVRTMLTLLDQQGDFDLYCAGVDSLAAMVPRLIQQRDLALAARVLTELARREMLNTGPWPELSARLRDALAVAAGPASMSALIHAVAEDRSLLPDARDIARHAGESGPTALVAEAVGLKAEGIEIAEELLGRRVVDLLNQLAGQAQWFQLAPIVSRLAREGDPRSIATLEQLTRRPDEQSRREVATGLAALGGPIASRLLGNALRDQSAEVAIVAARAIAKSGQPEAGRLLAARLGELDIDNADFLIGRELIAALARTSGPEADEALSRLAARRTLIKRGHFAEVQDLVRQALQYRAQAGGAA